MEEEGTKIDLRFQEKEMKLVKLPEHIFEGLEPDIIELHDEVYFTAPGWEIKQIFQLRNGNFVDIITANNFLRLRTVTNIFPDTKVKTTIDTKKFRRDINTGHTLDIEERRFDPNSEKNTYSELKVALMGMLGKELTNIEEINTIEAAINDIKSLGLEESYRLTKERKTYVQTFNYNGQQHKIHIDRNRFTGKSARHGTNDEIEVMTENITQQEAGQVIEAFLLRKGIDKYTLVEMGPKAWKDNPRVNFKRRVRIKSD